MDKTRTLPPLVRGKVAGVLDFFVDKIRLSRNILLLTNNFDLVLQVQWWGEVLPACIRPKALFVQGKTNRNSHFTESYYHSAKYEIKTTLDLFKSYLKCCEVVELCVLESFEHYVIGSAFLKDLIKLLNSNDELIKMPIFDYLGEEIGEVTVHVNFLEKPLQENKNHSKPAQICKNMVISKKLDKQDFSSKNKIKSCFSLAEKTIFYDAQSRKNEGELCMESGLPFTRNKSRKNENILNTKLSLSVSGHDFLGTNTKPIFKDQKCLPEIEALNDSSKVLHYGVSSQNSIKKTDIKNPETKINSKFNSNSIKCKSKTTKKIGSFSSDFNKNYKKINLKQPESSKTTVKKSTIPRKEKQFECQSSLKVNKFMKSEPQLHYESGPLRSVPSKESSPAKVLDYLLGSDMSKNDEETALNDFKKMSPSHHLVDSVSELCIFSSNDSTKSINKFSTNSSSRKTHLNFDFNNPIERNYYKKFFLKSNSPGDFEIAEFLNKPENSVMLNNLKSSETSLKKSDSETSDFNGINKFCLAGKEMKETEGEEYIANKISNGGRSSCARCKYYKKLNELDTIIESLKHFEEKMLLNEKLQNFNYKT